MTMTKKELKAKVRDLYEVLNCFIDTYQNDEYVVNYINHILIVSKINHVVERKIECREAVREIQKRKLKNEYIKTLEAFDVHEALGIDIKEARKKLKNFDFTTKEKNMIINKFKGGVSEFLKNFTSNTGVSN